MPPPEPVEQAKRDLRRAVLAHRDALTLPERTELSATITTRIEGLPEYTACQVIAGYASFGSEFLTQPLLQRALEMGRRVLLPRVDREHRRLTWHSLPAWAWHYFQPGPWNIPEPRPNLCPGADLLQADLLLCPGVAFDAHGGRIGYGGGFYDAVLRQLAHARRDPTVVAPAFELQIVEYVPRTTWDQLVPIIVTEARVIRTGNSPTG